MIFNFLIVQFDAAISGFFIDDNNKVIICSSNGFVYQALL